MADAYYIKVMYDPWAKHPSRKYARHNMYSICNKVFKVLSPIPTEEDIVSSVDGSVEKGCSCYLITRDDFLRVCPQFEEDPMYSATKTVAIPACFCVPWVPDGHFIEEGFRKSKRWVEEAEKLGRPTNPFTLKNSRWV